MAITSWMDTLEQIRRKDFRKAKAAEREIAAKDVINMCSYATALVSVSPIPFSDALVTVPLQTGMVVTIGHIYGRKLDSSEAKNLLLELGAAAGLSMLARQGVKALIPVVGALLTVPAAFAACWALGRVSMLYFQNPTASREDLDAAFRRAKQEAKSVFSREAFEKFRKKNQAAVDEAAQASDDAPTQRVKTPRRKAAAKKKPASRPRRAAR